MYDNSSMSKYEEIALDIANMIYKEDFKEGDRIHGRSTLAGMYNVSPETVRRAIKLLEDVDVVKSFRGSGIKVLSKDNAFKYINTFKNIESVASYKATLLSLLEQRNELEDEVLATIDKIIDRAYGYKNFEFFRLRTLAILHKSYSKDIRKNPENDDQKKVMLFRKNSKKRWKKREKFLSAIKNDII